MVNAHELREHAAATSRTSLPLLLLAGVIFGSLAWRFDFLCDDAYISFRYSLNLAEGRGLAFNPGESPPVEGYSNFLWVLWLALWEKLGVHAPTASRVTSVACGALLLYSVVRFGERRLALNTASCAALAVCFASLPTVAVWSTSGLETMPFALACFATFERLSSDPSRPRAWQAGFAALAAALLRADGALWAGVMIAAAALAGSRHGTRARLRALAITIGVLALGVALHLLWRHGYYGQWMPNTARVKAGLSAMRLERGAKYVAAFLLAVPSCALAPVAAAWIRPRASAAIVRASALVLFATGAYAIFVGGDFMPMGRFLVATMPFVALLFAVALQGLTRVPACIFAAVLVLLSLLPSFDVHVVPASVRDRVHFRWNEERARSEYAMWQGMRERADQWAVLGRALALHTKPGESLIAGNVGAIGYASRLWLYDLFGLVSPEVARRTSELVRASPGHDKAVTPEFFFDRRPTYLSAFLARRDMPPTTGLPEAWRKDLESGKLRLVTVPLDTAQGFPPSVELRLVRFDWSR